MQKHVLSKSTFIKGMQCNKALYYHKHHRTLKDPLTAAQEAIFAQGTSVGELACQLFPGGVDCTPESYYDFQKAVIRTQEEIERGTEVIYEAAFQFNGVLAVQSFIYAKIVELINPYCKAVDLTYSLIFSLAFTWFIAFFSTYLIIYMIF